MKLILACSGDVTLFILFLKIQIQYNLNITFAHYKQVHNFTQECEQHKEYGLCRNIFVYKTCSVVRIASTALKQANMRTKPFGKSATWSKLIAH